MRKLSDSTQLTRLRREMADQRRIMGDLVKDRAVWATRAGAAERELKQAKAEVAEWKARFDTLLRRDEAPLSLAQRIARRLFTNGSDELAQRLVLTVDKPSKRDLGGWSEACAVDEILEVMVAPALRRDTEGSKA